MPTANSNKNETDWAENMDLIADYRRSLFWSRSEGEGNWEVESKEMEKKNISICPRGIVSKIN